MWYGGFYINVTRGAWDQHLLTNVHVWKGAWYNKSSNASLQTGGTEFQRHGQETKQGGCNKTSWPRAAFILGMIFFRASHMFPRFAEVKSQNHWSTPLQRQEGLIFNLGGNPVDLPFDPCWQINWRGWNTLALRVGKKCWTYPGQRQQWMMNVCGACTVWMGVCVRANVCVGACACACEFRKLRRQNERWDKSECHTVMVRGPQRAC